MKYPVEMTASDIYEVCTRHKSGRWDTGEKILSDGWQSGPLKLVLSRGNLPVLIDGNKRASYLATHGGGDIKIPVEIQINGS